MIYLGLVSTPLILISLWLASYYLASGFLNLKNLYLNLGASWFLLFSILIFIGSLPYGMQTFNRMEQISKLIVFLFFMIFLLTYLTINVTRISAWQILLCLFVLFFSYLIVFSVNFSWVGGRPKSVMSSFGSLHSAKYAFLAEYTSQCSTIPAINHNVGQSIVSSMIKTLSGSTHTYILSWLLCFSILGFLLFSWGLIESFLSIRLSKLGLLLTGSLIVLGNFALSFALVLINDSGNPIALVGYSDTLFGIFAFLFLATFGFSDHDTKFYRTVLVLSIILVTLFYSAPQVLILMIVAIIYTVVQSNFLVFRRLIFSLVLSLLFWRGQSGLFAFVGSDGVAIPGFSDLNLEISVLSSESLSPGFPYLVGSFSSYPHEINPKVLDSSKELVASISEGEISRALWNLEQVFLSTLRPIFWPIIGLLTILILYRRRNKTLPDYVTRTRLLENRKISSMYILTVSYLLVTFPLTFLFKVNGLKWEMTRFTFPGLVAAMFFLVLLFTVIFQVGKRKVAAVFFVAVLTFPALLHMYGQIAQNLKYIEIDSYQTEVGRVGVFEEEIFILCN